MSTGSPLNSFQIAAVAQGVASHELTFVAKVIDSSEVCWYEVCASTSLIA